MKIENLNKANNDDGLMDMDQAAKYLCIKKSSLYQLCMRRKISVIKIGRLNKFRKADLDNFIKQNVVDAEN
ncbi:MAG: helix-turn-helix domain-containing protein [Planctomycetota bacterium]|jgi:excisionase family DNA binding protein